MSRQLPTRPLPATPVPIDYCGRNRRFVLRISVHIEQSLQPHLFLERTRYPYQPVGFRVRETIAQSARYLRTMSSLCVRGNSQSKTAGRPGTAAVSDYPSHRTRSVLAMANNASETTGGLQRPRISERQRPGRGQAAGAEAYSPWTVHTHGQSTTKPWQRIVRVHERALASAIPCPGTRSVRHRPECGPIQHQFNQACVLV